MSYISGVPIWISLKCYVKVLGEIRDTKKTYINIIRVIHSNPVVSTRLNGEKLKVISLKSETRQGCLLSHLNIVMGVVDR